MKNIITISEVEAKIALRLKYIDKIITKLIKKYDDLNIRQE
jgi:hypothetical protein